MLKLDKAYMMIRLYEEELKAAHSFCQGQVVNVKTSVVCSTPKQHTKCLSISA